MAGLIKTTINLPEDVLLAAKLTALTEKKTLSKLIAESLRRVAYTKDANKNTAVSPTKALGKIKLGLTKLYTHRSEIYEKQNERKVVI